MRTSRKNKQPMKYALQNAEIPIYQTDEDGNILYYEDSEGNKIPLETGETEIGFSEPVSFLANINNKLNEVVWAEYGIDDSTKFSQIVADKGVLPLKAGSIIWKKSEVGYKDEAQTIIDDTSCDYVVKGVADEGLSVDLFLLQKNLK
ncbi:MAG: hypothetical protein HFH72_08855 [Lachnospiraceae bacterium]|nr:hypothetical protein [Lachnospiraceae bacterium]